LLSHIWRDALKSQSHRSRNGVRYLLFVVLIL
jgi:hypothetical protein